MPLGLAKPVTRLVVLFLSVFLTLAIFTVVKNKGLLSPLGIESSSSDSQVMQAVERTQEVSLLSLHVEGIRDEDISRTIFGENLPFSERTMFVLYKFDAKLGIDGAQVNVTKRGADGYLISVPEFTLIGYDQPSFEIATEDGGVLSWMTPAIDQFDMVNDILSDKEQRSYVTSNEEALREQTEAFYDRLITSIDPSASTTYEFSSNV